MRLQPHSAVELSLSIQSHPVSTEVTREKQTIVKTAKLQKLLQQKNCPIGSTAMVFWSLNTMMEKLQVLKEYAKHIERAIEGSKPHETPACLEFCFTLEY